MGYNNKNKIADYQRIIEVYQTVKRDHIPDTRIVKNIFPKYDIHISYRTWMHIKGLRPSELQNA